MKPADGLKGPGLNNDGETSIAMPECVKIVSEKDGQDFKEFVAKIIRTTNENAIKQLKDLLGDQAPELIEHLMKRLSVQ